MAAIELNLPNIADGENKTSLLANRIRKNYKHLRKWAKRTNTDCFRIYEREIHQFPIAIDFYSGRFCVHYFSPTREVDTPPKELVKATEDAIKTIFDADSDVIFWRTRAKRKETRQYEKAGESRDYFTATEYGVKFKINLTDYLDTGLFLDHRETRRLVAEQCQGLHVLNLFAYTCSFSVHAALSGALFTKSVDMSNTYTAWGKDNFKLNSIPLKNNHVVRADCLKFMDEEICSGVKYDVIIIDPPTISRSKKMEQLFDIQLDYVQLINKSLRLLNKGGVIYFSTNSRKFILDETLFATSQIVDISHKTLPIDFRDPKIHRVWKIQITPP